MPELNPDYVLYPYFDYKGERLEMIPHSTPSEWESRWTSQWRGVVADSQILCMVNQAIEKAKWLTHQEVRHWRRQPDPLPPLDWGTVWAHPPDTASTKKAWQISEDTIHLIANSCRSHGAQLFIVALDTPVEVSPDLKERERFLKKEKLLDFGYAERRLRSVAEREGAGYYALGPELGEYAARTGHTLHGFGRVPADVAHLNEEGNIEAGRLIGKAMRKTYSMPDQIAANSGTPPRTR